VFQQFQTVLAFQLLEVESQVYRVPYLLRLVIGIHIRANSGDDIDRILKKVKEKGLTFSMSLKLAECQEKEEPN